MHGLRVASALKLAPMLPQALRLRMFPASYDGHAGWTCLSLLTLARFFFTKSRFCGELMDFQTSARQDDGCKAQSRTTLHAIFFCKTYVVGPNLGEGANSDGGGRTSPPPRAHTPSRTRVPHRVGVSLHSDIIATTSIKKIYIIGLSYFCRGTC